LVNETVRIPPAPAGSRLHKFSERSLYAVPSSGQTGAKKELVLLLRTSENLWASRCALPQNTQHRDAHSAGSNKTEEQTFSCKSGTGAYMFEQPSTASAALSEHVHTQAAVTCDWTLPAETNIPDAPSRTCAGHLPRDLGVGLIGNNGGPPNGGRDPLSFLVAEDGIHFSTHWIVEIGAPTPKWPTLGHPRGFQYPSFLWCVKCGAVAETIMFSYSASKEDIRITVAPLASIVNATALRTDDGEAATDVLGGRGAAADGAHATLERCDARAPAQRWRLRAGWGDNATLVNSALGGSDKVKCLTVDGFAVDKDGALVSEWSCALDPAAKDYNQQWFMGNVKQLRVATVAREPGKCLSTAALPPAAGPLEPGCS
jgi:hypothetical protein